MPQTKLLGLTFDEAMAFAALNYACDTVLHRLRVLGSWRKVLQTDRLPVYATWFEEAMTPVPGCDCSLCKTRARRETPEVVARRETLAELLKGWRMMDGPATRARDWLEAKLREHLTD